MTMNGSKNWRRRDSIPAQWLMWNPRWPCRPMPRVVKIQSEIPTRIVVAAQMETPGLLVLADRWDQGWRGLSQRQAGADF